MSESAKERFFRFLSLFQAGQLHEAEAGLAKALRVSPKDPNLLHLAAQTAEALGEKPRAAQLYRRAMAAHPGWFEAGFNLARLLQSMEGPKAKRDSLALLRQLAGQHPSRPEASEALARLAQADGHLEEAAADWRRALALAPHNPGGRGQYYLCCRQLCDWSDPPVPSPDLPPHIVTALFDDPALLKESAERHSKRLFGGIAPLPPAPPWSHERLRVGYLSSDFHAHATSWLMAELFTLHDKDRFEVFVYSYGIDDGSAIRERLKQEAEHFIDLRALTPKACAERLRADEIDLLVDLKGHTHGGRLDILAHRPAPVQLHWLGFPGTTGAPFLDYFVGDKITVPIEAERFLTERVLRLPHSYQINDRQKAVAAAPPRADCGLPEEALILASFNQSYKITPELFDLWCEILQELPGAVLWLYETFPEASARLRAVAQARGLDPARLVFATPLPLERHLARYHLVDLALDTYPVGGHTTTSDALWVGAPVVTRAGQSFVSRVAASLLSAAELPSLVTTTPEAYKKRILDLARNKAARDAIRAHLTGKHEALPLFDTPRFVRDWERLLLSCAVSSKTSSS